MPGFYEKQWTVFTIVDVLIGRAESITLEPPGTIGHGFEFFVDRRWGREWHQVKYQNAELGKWTFAALRDENVLMYFRNKLKDDDDCSCVFVSAHAAHPLGRLCDSAAESASLQQFIADFLSSKLLIDSFGELQQIDWSVDDLTAWDWLRRRISIKTVDGQNLEDWIKDRAEAYFNEPSAQVAMALEKVSESILYRAETTSSLVPKLAALGATLRTAGSPDAALQRGTQRFLTTAEVTLVNKEYIPRPAVSDIEHFLRRSGVSSVIVTGGKGCGKTTVLAQVVQHLTDDGVKVVTIDVTTLSTEASSFEVGQSLGLNLSPIKASARAAGAEELIVIIDSLDSVAASRGKPPTLFGAIAEILRECKSYPNITLLVSCRSQDLETDARVRALLQDPDPARTVDICPLSIDETTEAIRISGYNPSDLNPGQIEVLRVPANLKMFTKLPPSRVRPFSSEQELAATFVEWSIEP